MNDILKYDSKLKEYYFYDEDNLIHRFKSSTRIVHYAFILYEDSTVPNWRDVIGRVIPYPIAYCTHDKDIVLDQNGNIVEDRKIHTHVLVCIPTGNPTTYKHLIDLISPLLIEGNSMHHLEPVENVLSYYKYLIHDTDDARKKNKFPYDPDERILLNDFDISDYVQLTVKAKKENRKILIEMVNTGSITSFQQLLDMAFKMGDNDDMADCVINNQYLFTRLIYDNKDKELSDKIEKAHLLIETQSDAIFELRMKIKVLESKLNQY